MRIVFIGAVEFSAHCLQEILKNQGHVVSIFTLADSRTHLHADFANLSEIAETNNLPIHYVRNINHPRNIKRIQAFNPDIIFVFGWSQLISQDIINIPPQGCIGTHPALLPKNGGRHPIVWALVEGLQETGLTFFYLDEDTDSGDILWQKAIPITLEDDAATLYQKIQKCASAGITDFLPLLEQHQAVRTPQDHSKATYWRKRTKKDGEIDWTTNTLTAYNLIRALTHPYIGAHTYHQNAEVKIWKAQLINKSQYSPPQRSPGQIIDISAKGHLIVKTTDHALEVSAYEHSKGVPILIGDTLETRA
ncbi:MAG: methionyl-tRNA formyltransferase [Candidatus Latescibacteria bacterium]|nr:methionyl-tRNA formyltransferase [Candidatus Latescibacterota bacterium]